MLCAFHIQMFLGFTKISMWLNNANISMIIKMWVQIFTLEFLSFLTSNFLFLQIPLLYLRFYKFLYSMYNIGLWRPCKNSSSKKIIINSSSRKTDSSLSTLGIAILESYLIPKLPSTIMLEIKCSTIPMVTSLSLRYILQLLFLIICPSLFSKLSRFAKFSVPSL